MKSHSVKKLLLESETYCIDSSGHSPLTHSGLAWKHIVPSDDLEYSPEFLPEIVFEQCMPLFYTESDLKAGCWKSRASQQYALAERTERANQGSFRILVSLWIRFGELNLEAKKHFLRQRMLRIILPSNSGHPGHPD
jgi:hypothetical protein